MLYTRKGDGGTTKTFGCNQRMSKSSAVAEALGALDEVNSFLGLVKVAAQKAGYVVDVGSGTKSFAGIVHNVQETLFIIQAEVAGFPKPLPENKVQETEEIIDTIEKMLPPIKTFFISGGTELASLFDVSRTMARRAERRVVGYKDEQMMEMENGDIKPVWSSEISTSTSNATVGDTATSVKTADTITAIAIISDATLAYLNRLSSLLYALARFSNHLAGISETSPSYK